MNTATTGIRNTGFSTDNTPPTIASISKKNRSFLRSGESDRKVNAAATAMVRIKGKAFIIVRNEGNGNSAIRSITDFTVISSFHLVPVC